MNILVVSDTHGRADRLRELSERVRPDMLLFLGDGLRDLYVLPESLDVLAVRGNCDWSDRDTPDERVVRIGKYTVFMTHGHRYGVKSSLEAAVAAAIAAGADVLLYGHTHRPMERCVAAGRMLAGIELPRGLTVLCPGSLGDPPDGVPSFGTLTVKNEGILAALGSFFET